MIIRLFILILWSVPAGLFGAQSDVAGAATAAAWLNTPSSPRALSMGQAFAAMDGGLDSLGVNPAGLSGLQGLEAVFSHSNLIEDSNLEHLALGLKLFGTSALAAGFDYLNLGSVDNYQVDGSGVLTPDGQFAPMAYSASLSAAQDIGWGVVLGLTGRAVVQNLDGQNDTALAGDLGVLYHAPGGFSAGASTTSRQSSLGGYGTASALRLGASYQMDRLGLPLTLESDAIVDRTGRFYTQWMGGAEYRPLAGLALRGGWHYTGPDQPSGPTFGAGYAFRWIGLDYCLNMGGALGLTHQFALTARLPDLGRMAEERPAAATPQPAQSSALAAPVAPSAQPASTESDQVVISRLVGLLAIGSKDAPAVEAALAEVKGRGAATAALASDAIREKAVKPAAFRGNLEIAMAAARVRTRLEPGNASAWQSLGTMEWQSGAQDQAVRDLEKALTLDPSLVQVRQLLKK